MGRRSNGSSRRAALVPRRLEVLAALPVVAAPAGAEGIPGNLSWVPGGNWRGTRVGGGCTIGRGNGPSGFPVLLVSKGPSNPRVLSPVRTLLLVGCAAGSGPVSAAAADLATADLAAPVPVSAAAAADLGAAASAALKASAPS